MRIAIILTLLFVTSISAQSAKVITISPADSAELKDRWDSLQQAQKDWDTIHERIVKTYTVVSNKDEDAGDSTYYGSLASGGLSTALTSGEISITSGGDPCYKETPEQEKKREAEEQKARDDYYKNLKFYRRGWENGFDFTKDFKFIVPRPQSSHSLTGSVFISSPAVVAGTNN